MIKVNEFSPEDLGLIKKLILLAVYYVIGGWLKQLVLIKSPKSRHKIN